MAQVNEVAKQFVDYYYSTFDSNRANLAPLYRPNSMLSFEGAQTQGGQAIIEKLVGLSFKRVVHKITSLDAQPSASPSSILVSVTGALMVDEEQNPMQFSQTFQLLMDGGSYYVFNDIFRLILN
ncbi:hypothetical protein SeMB42_g06288 [Synchytrium endobioticum]|uniref:Nuclear transport factor 2 n=1 Tax=Synchytrium endobioticum TaxID=286115 RepID=A0A507CWE9_9FUNG|nr:hypothetical protein SeMB42_g06288 [Synchytrium endobioticum]TPX43486.1 hypothetical protein SeLEV6574_g05038 [Synchytrium endobioticum]